MSKSKKQPGAVLVVDTVNGESRVVKDVDDDLLYEAANGDVLLFLIEGVKTIKKFTELDEDGLPSWEDMDAE